MSIEEPDLAVAIRLAQNRSKYFCWSNERITLFQGSLKSSCISFSCGSAQRKFKEHIFSLFLKLAHYILAGMPLSAILIAPH